MLALTGVAHRPASAASQRRVPAPRHNIAIYAGLCITRHQQGFTRFTRPIFPSPAAPGWNGSPWAFPRASHPAPCVRRTSGWGQAIEHGPETTLYVIDLASNPALFTQCVRPRVARDIAEVSRRPVASLVFASRRQWPGHASSSVKSSTALRRRSPGDGIAPPSVPEMSALASSGLQRNFWLVQPFSMNGATRRVRGRMTAVVPGIGLAPRGLGPRGDQCAPRGGERRAGDSHSERVGSPEDAVARFAQGWSSSRRGACRWRRARAFRRARAGARARAPCPRRWRIARPARDWRPRPANRCPAGTYRGHDPWLHVSRF